MSNVSPTVSKVLLPPSFIIKYIYMKHRKPDLSLIVYFITNLLQRKTDLRCHREGIHTRLKKFR